MNAVLRTFGVTWLGYFSLLVLLPLRYTSVELGDALVVIGCYVLLSVACALLTQVTAPPGFLESRGVLRTSRPMSEPELGHLVIVGLIVSAVGMLLIAYMRVAVQGINYSQGLAVARELWRVEGVEREGVSSPLSIPGYGLGFFFLPSTFIAHLQWEQLSPRLRRTVIVSTLAFIVGYSVLTGGRSVLLTQLISVLAAATVRRAQGRRGFPGNFWRTALFAALAFAAAAAYALYIFADRAGKTLGTSPDLYVEAAIAFMGGTTTPAFSTISRWPAAVAGPVEFATLAGAYMTHSAGTLASVMEYSAHHGITVFAGLWNLAARLDLATPGADDWVLNGTFLSLPGSFWYQFGEPGVLVAGLATGFSLGVVYRYCRRGRGGGISLAFAAASLITAMYSPLIFAPDSLAFPFMILGYLGLAGYARMRFGPRNWWMVGYEGELTRSTVAREPQGPDRRPAS